MMTAIRASCVEAAQPSSPTPKECCMCGDQGLSYELFNCKICLFRCQHRYCSNLYPKAETYKVCNWCLYQKDDTTTEKAQNYSSNSSSSLKNNNSETDDHHVKIKIKRRKTSDRYHQKGIKGNLQLQGNKPIKKQMSPEGSSITPTGGIKKMITGGGLKERLRRTKSDNISNGGGKLVIRNKVRRYKLLDEVNSQ